MRDTEMTGVCPVCHKVLLLGRNKGGAEILNIEEDITGLDLVTVKCYDCGRTVKTHPRTR